jgi:hypothetical protein
LTASANCVVPAAKPTEEEKRVTRTKPTIYIPGPWFKWTFLSTAWLLAFLGLVILSANNELNMLCNASLDFEPELRQPRNQTGAISYIYWDTKEDYRPVYSVSFKNLLLENNRLGVFKTALHKLARIQDLELRFHQHKAPVTEPAAGIGANVNSQLAERGRSRISLVPWDQIANATGLMRRLMHRLKNPDNDWRISNNIDFGHVSELTISNFDYQVFWDDTLFFAIKSKRALVSYKQPTAVLRGQVTITGADGSTLESNHVRWDVRKQLFTAKGVYVLNRNGLITSGRGICVDAQLNNVQSRHSNVKREEEREWYAKF